MKKISFDTKNGYLLLSGVIIAPLNEYEFTKTAEENNIEIENNQTPMYIVYQRAEN